MPHERGYLTRYLDVATQPVDTTLVRAAELVVVLGGPVGANDADRYPFLADELAALRARPPTGRRRWEAASARSCRPSHWAHRSLPARHERSAMPR
ncbi:hypothetical protein [Streptomyces rugosispiralis]|uniref:Uncharacterized protein n=1 Tax=Streptomyces rugosispiralis TaxID=2967341 RepID=A0ABT1UNQ3_9ACTN|nr:hypothetical protein [Streptomyces rugosispiralis]MCQ8186769.1 hypothetical protein [Streptomyces rugosispiralis]